MRLSPSKLVTTSRGSSFLYKIVEMALFLEKGKGNRWKIILKLTMASVMHYIVPLCRGGEPPPSPKGIFVSLEVRAMFYSFTSPYYCAFTFPSSRIDLS